MVNSKEWEEFRETGLLWFINTILHLFGWSIVYNFTKSGKLDVYPARVKFRGFSENRNTEGYIKVSKYLQENIEELLKEAKED